MAPNGPEDPAAQARERFDDAYELLRTGFELTADRDRDEMSFEELVAEHETMEALRGDAHLAKKGIVSRFAPPAHEHVDVPVGIPDTSRTGKVFAAVSALAILGAVVAILVLVGRGDGIELERWDEVVSDTRVGEGQQCVWTIRVGVMNTTDEAISVDRAFVVVDRARARVRVVSAPETIRPDTAATPIVFGTNVDRLGDGRCPRADELNHGSLTIEFRLGAERAFGRTTAHTLRF
jgi:hypothetical protein